MADLPTFSSNPAFFFPATNHARCQTEEHGGSKVYREPIYTWRVSLLYRHYAVSQSVFISLSMKASLSLKGQVKENFTFIHNFGSDAACSMQTN